MKANEMKTMMWAILALTAIAMTGTAQAEPQVNQRGGGSSGVGGGGDVTAFEFKNVARYLLSDLRKMGQAGVSEFNFDELERAIRFTEVRGVEVACLDGTVPAENCPVLRRRDAVNFPDRGLITVTASRWTEIKPSLQRLRALVLHEYLGILGAEKGQDDDRISSAVVTRLRKQLFRVNASPFSRLVGHYDLMAGSPDCPQSITIEQTKDDELKVMKSSPHFPSGVETQFLQLGTQLVVFNHGYGGTRYHSVGKVNSLSGAFTHDRFPEPGYVSDFQGDYDSQYYKALDEDTLHFRRQTGGGFEPLPERMRNSLSNCRYGRY